MILYEEDFEMEGAIVDTLTSNTSFVRMHVMLVNMGIKNNKFFLALYDTNLIGVDPFSPDLTDEQKIRIAVECKRNYWYFIRECVKVPEGGSDGVRYVLNRANLAQAWCFLNSIDSFQTMPRQIGKTIGALCLTAWFTYFSGYNVSVGLFAKGTKLVWENVSRLKGIRNRLPKYLIKEAQEDSDNKEGIYYAALKNQYKTFVAQSDKQAAMDQGRGESFSWEHWDEISYYDNNFLSFSSAIAATNTQGPQTRANGLPCALLITTTAGDIDSEKGMYAFNMKNDCLRFTEKLYNCKDVTELNAIMTSDSKNGMIYLEYSHTQLGKDDAWFRKVTRPCDAKTIAKDYLNIWQYGSENTVLTKILLDRLVKSEREPDHIQTIRGITFRWYVPQYTLEDSNFLTKSVIIGSDTSNNIGKDFTSILILDPTTLSVIGVARTNQVNLFQTCECLLDIFKLFPNSIFIPERNANGCFMADTIIDLMKYDKSFQPLKRIFNHIYQNYDDYSNRMHQIDFSLGTWRKLFGFNTSASETSRDTLYKSVMTMALNLGVDRVCDRNLSDEFRSLCVKNGRIDHPNGGHDDLVIAYLLACWFVFYGKGHHLYNLDVRELLSSVSGSGDTVDPELKQRHIQYRARIVDLEKLTNTTTNLMMLRQYERELKDLKLRYDESIAAVSPIAVSQIQFNNTDQIKQSVSRIDPIKYLQSYY